MHSYFESWRRHYGNSWGMTWNAPLNVKNVLNEMAITVPPSLIICSRHVCLLYLQEVYMQNIFLHITNDLGAVLADFLKMDYSFQI